MTKILLVEDDKSLREIYGVRLFAEGYDVVSAGDGEKALAVAIKERPALIITDVMMPKISGFDMLDILRSTTETKDIKVIVMTALGSDDNRERGERLGADKYLVKSQVGIEDVVREVHNLLGDQPTPNPTMQMPTQQPPASAAMISPNGQPATPAFGMQNIMTPGAPGVPAPAMPRPSAQSIGEAPSRRPRVIQPINYPEGKVDIQALVDKELAKEGSKATTAAEQQQVVNSQLDTFSKQPAPAPGAGAPAPSAAAPAGNLPQPVPPAATAAAAPSNPASVPQPAPAATVTQPQATAPADQTSSSTPPATTPPEPNVTTAPSVSTAAPNQPAPPRPQPPQQPAA